MNVQVTKIEKISIGLVLVGIFLGIVRTIIYVNFLGSFLDFLWALVFALIIYEKNKKYKYILIPLILGYSFELFQLVCEKIGIVTHGYYPGTYDFLDVVAYTMGCLAGYIILVFLNRSKGIKKPE